MGNEPEDAVDFCLREVQTLQHRKCLFRAELLLDHAVISSILDLSLMDANVMDICRSFKNELGLCIQSFFQTDLLGKGMDFQKVVNPFRIATIIMDHGFAECHEFIHSVWFSFLKIFDKFRVCRKAARPLIVDESSAL